MARPKGKRTTWQQRVNEGLSASTYGASAGHESNEHLDEYAYGHAPAFPESSGCSLRTKDMLPAKGPLMNLISIHKNTFGISHSFGPGLSNCYGGLEVLHDKRVAFL